MDPLTAVLGVVVSCFGATLVVAPRAVVRTLRVGGASGVDPALDRTRRTFGAVATALGTYAVAVGVGVA